MAHVLLIGAGAVGAWTGARLAEAGHTVTVASRTKKTAQAIEEGGLRAEEPDGGAVTALVRSIHRPGELEGEPDVVLLATKCAAAERAWKTWRKHVRDAVPVIAMQNGLVGDALAPLAGDRLVLCTVAFPATFLGPGASRRTGPGGFFVGSWPVQESGAAAELAQSLLSDAAETRLVPDIEGVQWTKLLINSCITSLGVLTGRELGDLLRDRRAREVFLRIVSEGYAAGRAEGVDFASLHGFHPVRFADDGSAAHRWLRHQLLKVVGAKYRRHRSSSLQSLDRGQKTEVDFLNGAIVAAAARNGLHAPVNEAVVERVHAIEEGELAPSDELLDELVG